MLVNRECLGENVIVYTGVSVRERVSRINNEGCRWLLCKR